jgi:drug/metabolite transporter (DMT)-like permease
MKPAYLIILLVLNVVWSATLSIYKVLEPYLEPGGIVTLRFGLAVLPLLLLWPWLPGDAPRGRDLLNTCLIGLAIFTLGHRLQVFGNKLSTASNSAVLMAVEPLITSVAAAIFLREHIGPRRMLGFALGMTGVVLLNGVWRPEFKWVSLGASVIFISSFVCETAFSVVGKPIIARASPVKFIAMALAVGTVANLFLDGRETLTAAAQLPVRAWLLLMIMAFVCTSFGYTFWLLVIRESEVNLAALTIFLQPVFGLLIAKLWLDESLHWGQFWGSAAIITGLVVGLSRQIKSSAERS